MRVYVVENKSDKDRDKPFAELTKVFSDAKKAADWIKEVGPKGNLFGPITEQAMLDTGVGSKMMDYVGGDKVEVFVTEVVE